MIYFMSLMLCAAFVNADVCDSSMMQWATLVATNRSSEAPPATSAELEVPGQTFPLLKDGSVLYDDDVVTDEHEGSKLRVALFVTTAGSPQHKTFLDGYPKFIGKRLKKADVIMHFNEKKPVGEEERSKIMEAMQKWTDGNTSVHYYPNLDYQHGAMKSMHDGFSNRWFEGYDWVIRINLDVVIYDESRLFHFMDMPNISAIFVACCSHPSTKPDGNSGGCIRMTDFFAVRPSKLARDAWAGYANYSNAEHHATQVFAPIVRESAYAMLAQPSRIRCRTHGGGVWHFTSKCPSEQQVAANPSILPWAHNDRIASEERMQWMVR